LKSEYTYWWTVKAVVPDATLPSSRDTQSFAVKFRALSLEEMHEIQAKYANAADLDMSFQAETMIKRIVVDWDENVVGEDGQCILFSAAALEKALQMPWFGPAVLAAYNASPTPPPTK
jgi:hypothetical protein